MMRVVLGILAVLILAALGGVGWLYSGTYPVAATKPHTALGAWVLETAKRQSVRAHARGTATPPLSDFRQIEEGARLFQSRCALCHGAPGTERQDFASAMNPVPPHLADEVGHWTSAELHWIIRQGLRMTGMPAWGPNGIGLDDKQIWLLVAFLNQLPTMDPQRYQAIVAPEPQAPAPKADEEAERQPLPEDGTGHDLVPPPEQDQEDEAPPPPPPPQQQTGSNPGPGPMRLLP